MQQKGCSREILMNQKLITVFYQETLYQWPDSNIRKHLSHFLA